MLRKLNNFLSKYRANNAGFSLVEVLIAIGILVIITVPLAMNMISSSQLNSKAKQVSSSSDLTTSIMEVVQTVDLSDVLADVNGYDTDEYGTKLPYTLTGTALKNYKIESTAEVILQDGGKYAPVLKQEDVFQDYLVTSSIKTRTTGDVLRTYFTGQKNNEYAFLLSGVETDESLVDVVAIIKPEQTFSIVNITSMSQSEVIYVKQPAGMDQSVANEFKKSNEKYIALKGSVMSIGSKSSDWFLKNMERTISVDIKQDKFTDATTITMTATYTVETDCLREGDRTIVKNLGSFSTNSTAEFSRGIYVYYYPLKDFDNTSIPRDHFVINNKNELSTPVYLIAMSSDSGADVSSLVNYHPTLTVNELSSEIYKQTARTVVCSNIENVKWTKSLYPIGRTLEVKTLGNVSERQTLYSIVLRVYQHNSNSYDEDGVFSPRSKDLLVETSGTFLDTSEKLDIDSDKTTGPNISQGIAEAYKNGVLVYTGEELTGVRGLGVVWTGVTKATDAGTYVATATPLENYSWRDGTASPKTFTWTIERAKIATAGPANHTYCKETVIGVAGEFVTYEGTTEAMDAGSYTAYATPDSNHAWEDGTYQTKSVKWRIYAKEVEILWATGDGKDTWMYDGETHSGSCTIVGVISGDKCEPTLTNNSIKNIGQKTAYISALSNKNYTLPEENLTHVLTVKSLSSASIVLKNKVVYNGAVQSVVDSSEGVRLSGTSTAKNVGTYQLIATPLDGYTWPNGQSNPVVYTWTITPRPAELEWGENSWVYDGKTHSTTCIVANAIEGDTVIVYLENNEIRNAGSVTVTAIGLSNNNYALNKGELLSYVLTVHRAPIATYSTSDFNYDGLTHVGVTGQHINRQGVYATSEVLITNGAVAPYVVKVTPMSNYAWSDGTYGEKLAEWTIYPVEDAWYEYSDMMYTGTEITGVFGRNTTYTGSISGTNIGTYTAILTPSPNHAWKDTGTMEPRSVTWKIEISEFIKPVLAEADFVYNGQTQSPQIQDIGLNDGYILQGNLSATNAGTYRITAKLKDPNNTTWLDGSNNDVVLEWRILPKEVGIQYSADENTWTYDGQYHYGNATATGLCGSDTCEFYYTNNERKNAGSQTFTISGVSNGNYKLPDSGLLYTMTINQKVIDIEWGQVRWTYDGNEKVVTATATGLVNDDVCVVRLKDNKRTNAGSQIVVVIQLSNANYTFDSVHPLIPPQTTMTIDKSPTATAKPISGLVYNGNNQQGVSGDYVAWTGITSATDAGDYAATAKPDSNHLWPDGTDGEKQVEWSIERQRTATASKSNKTYTGSSQTGVTGNCVDWSGTTKATNAGTYTAYATPKDNYAWSDGTYGKKTITWIMNKASGSVTAPTAKTLTYNGSAQQLVNAGSTNYGEVYYRLGTSGDFTTTIPTATNVGTYTVYYYSSGDKNHNATSQSKYVTVTIKGRVASYAVITEHRYDGTQKTIYNQYTGVTWSGVRYATNAGTYTAYVTPVANYMWSDGSTDTKTITWEIKRSPTASLTYYKTLAWCGSQAYSPIITNTHCVLSGTTNIPPAQGMGSYTFTVRPENNYAWADGSDDTITVSWILSGGQSQNSGKTTITKP